ncbi:MAG: xanthine dehydrogenase family protein molybdopterin-binding subunit [Acidobacteria bacterium]|nr:xanthine dehydrogenase family protein molybdopterin-binding subunit [Acidobacteriota bacterium]
MTRSTSMTHDAQAALDAAGLTRRDFVRRSGLLIVAFSAARAAGDLGLVPDTLSAQGINGPGSPQLDAWLAIGADGRVTAYTGKCELGTGLYTAQTQLVAEELCVPIDRVRLIQCDTSMTPDQGTTSGAQSHPTNFNKANLALAGATAREALLQLGAKRLGMPVESLVAIDGTVRAKSDASKSVGYGDLIGGQKFNLMLNRAAARKPVSEWKVLGTSVPRLDFPAIVTGQFEYVHNVRVAGMAHGRVVRPPALGATLTAVDESSVQGLPGVLKVVVRKNWVGVVAEKPWQAEQAARQLKATWSAGTALPDQGTFHERLHSQTATRDALSVDSGDVEAKLASAAKVIKATYRHPYQMHASIATACAVADVKTDAATIYSATQAVYPLRSTMAMVLGLKPEGVRIIFRQGPGCYGVNGADAVSYDAALMSQAVGRPVRVQLARKDEMAWENYGPAYVIDERVGLDANGTIVCWDYQGWTLQRGNRPGGNAPGNVVSGMLAGFEPQMAQPRSPAPAPTGEFDNGNNTVPNSVTGCIGGMCGGTGTVASERVLSRTVASPFFTGPLRSPARLQNTFAHESFMDEIAASAKADPVAYRLRHLSDPRLRDVVTAAAGKAGWDARPSPRTGSRRTGVATGRGIACVLYEGDNGYCALVTEVEVNQDTGLVLVKRCVAAIDVGPVSNPNGLRNQLEGGLIHGMSRALREEVTWSGDRVTSIDWRTYRPWFVGDPVPVIESVIVNRPDAPATGAGETSITVTAASIGNAIFDATGARLRQLPFTPERVKAALAARG